MKEERKKYTPQKKQIEYRTAGMIYYDFTKHLQYLFGGGDDGSGHMLLKKLSFF